MKPIFAAPMRVTFVFAVLGLGICFSSNASAEDSTIPGSSRFPAPLKRCVKGRPTPGPSRRSARQARKDLT